MCACFFFQLNFLNDVATHSSPNPSLVQSGIFQRWWVTAWPVRSTTQKWSLTSRNQTWPSGSRSCNSKSWATGWKMHWMATTWTSRTQVGPFLISVLSKVFSTVDIFCMTHQILSAVFLFTFTNSYMHTHSAYTTAWSDLMVWFPLLNQSRWHLGPEE